MLWEMMLRDRWSGGMLVSRRRAGQAVAVALSEQEQAVLSFESNWWTEPGDKVALVEVRFGLAPDRYAALVAELIDRPDALDFDPLLVRRLRRLRDRSRRARADERAAKVGELS